MPRKILALATLMVGLWTLAPGMAEAQPRAYYTGLDLQAIGDTETALMHLREAFDTAPQNVDVQQAYVQLLYQRPSKEYRETMLDSVLPEIEHGRKLRLVADYPDEALGGRLLERNRYSDHPGFILWNAEEQLAAGDPEETRELLDLLEPDELNLDQQLREAWLYGEAEDRDEAQKRFQNIRELRPEVKAAYLGEACWGSDSTARSRAWHRYKAFLQPDPPEELNESRDCHRDQPGLDSLGWMPITR